jgi:hypothetical protein
MSQGSIGHSKKWPARMRRRELSEYLFEVHGIRLSPATLAKLCVLGGHPEFQYDGRFPVTTPAAADAFAVARLGAIRRSTSDDGHQLATA